MRSLPKQTQLSRSVHRAKLMDIRSPVYATSTFSHPRPPSGREYLEMTVNVVYHNLTPHDSTGQKATMSSCIQSAADNIMSLLEAEKAPLLRELEHQRRQIFSLELQNAALQQRFEAEHHSTKDIPLEKVDLCSLVTDKGLEELKDIPTPLRNEHQGADSTEDQDLALQLLAAQDQIARMKDHVREHAGALALALAAEREANLKEKQAMQHNFVTELEACRKNLQVVQKDGELATRKIERMTNGMARLIAALEYHGVAYKRDAGGQVSITFGAEVQRAMVEVVAEAKRRGLVPDNMEWAGLEAGNITLATFATLVDYILKRAKANEQKIAHALKEARSKGLSVAQFLQEGNLFRQGQQTGVPTGQI
ncbi:hypothetical protein BKA70DRAFT_1428889 [Coprinopsis sp. MPI-PUGE-AT-0042]|nr:hypothetical protein BKA70DRAFT_1428889 [Coprinopsis sp. MPI-PUGE-AT-0042]